MKKFAVLVASALFLGSVAGCSATKPAATPVPTPEPTAAATPSPTPEATPAAKTTLVVSNFALADDRIKETVIAPFEKENNCTVVYEGGTNAERLTKLKNDPNTTVDVIYLAQQFAQQGVDAGLFEEFDYAKVPNSADILKKADIFKDSKQGPPTTMNRLGIIYNPEKAGDIKSFSDIWKAEYKEKVAIPDISTTFGPAMVTVAAKHAGVDYATDNGEAAFKALADLKPNIVKTYTKSSDLKNMFSSGEITVALAAEFAYNTMGDASVKLVFLDPAEGSYLNFNTINIVKSSKNKDLAYKFVDFVLSQENQLNAAINVPESAVNTKVQIPAEVASKLTTVETADKCNVVDFTVVNKQLTDWIDKWNKTLNQ